MTLQKLQSLEAPGEEGEEMYHQNFMFSPDSRVLTACSYGRGEVLVVSWDLPTGATAGVTRWDIPKGIYYAYLHITYSTNGRLVAVLHKYDDQPISISICDIVSSKRMHNIDPTINAIPCGLWTHEESLWFTTIDQTIVGATGTWSRSITVWKVGFTPGATITRVETFPLSEIFTFPMYTYIHSPQSSAYSQPFPTTRLPVVLLDGPNFLVLEARTSKVLLYLQDINEPLGITYSSGGSFFVCSIPESGIYLWKDSPTGYVLHGKLPLPTPSSTPVLSPNGESIIVISDFVVKFWRTESLAITPSDGFVGALRQTDNFILQFLPHRSLAVVSRNGDSTVTLLDFGTGDPQLTVNAGVKVRGLGATEDTVVVISDEGATTWKLLRGIFTPGATMDVADSIQTVYFDPRKSWDTIEPRSMSPDSRYILIRELSGDLLLHSATTGKLLGRIYAQGEAYWFTPDGRTVGVTTSEDEGTLFEIRNHSNILGVTIDIEHGKYGCPYTSSDYRVTDGGWILGPGNERLLILPPLWRSHTRRRMWNGQFLALLHGTLSVPVIIELTKPTSLSK